MSLALAYDRIWGPEYGSTPVNVSSASPTLLVAGLANHSIWVLSYILVSAEANSITLEDGDGTVVCGPMSFAANGGVAAPFNPAGHFRLPSGKGLYMHNSGAGQVGGNLTYIYF